jgi:SAM-dependent methyltransferase
MFLKWRQNDGRPYHFKILWSTDPEPERKESGSAFREGDTMNDKPEGTPIPVDEIMARIRREAQQRKPVEDTFCPTPSPLSSPSFLREPLVPKKNPLPHKEVYELREFLDFHGPDFLKTVYTALLGRLPDVQGQTFYLAKLENGGYTKTEIVGRLRYSREGRKKKVAVKALFLPFMFQIFYKIPLLGWALRIITGVSNLPGILKNIQRVENLTHAHQRSAEAHTEKIGTHVAELCAHMDKLQEEMHLAQEELALKVEETVTTFTEKVSETISETQAETQADRDQLSELWRQTRDHKLNIIDMQRRIQFFLEEARKRLPEPFSPEQLEKMVQEEDHLFDPMYVSFEDRFRGTREDIKERVRVYLPDLEKALVTTKNARVLDVGCGRGEWLELLRENDIQALGLDLNQIMVAQCRELGLEVLAADVITHLKSLPSNTLGAVTGFHLIEHLPQKILIALLDESLRVLKPGGIVIFETPNPENILVGAHYFYTDPSHLNPLVPATTQFILEQRGFIRVEIRRLHKYSDYFPVTDADEFKTTHMYNEMDFAVIGTKA